MYSLFELKQALIYGSENNYVLFPEAREIKHKDQIDDIEAAAKMSLEVGSPVINFNMYKEFENTGNRLIFENAYFERRKQLFSLVLAYMLNGTQEYKAIIEEKLWEWCELYSWELPAHFKMTKESMDEGAEEPDKTVALFAAESAFFFSEILSLIGNELDGFLVFRLKKEIFRRVINPYKNSSYWWDTAEMNWSSVCAGSVGAAAIYLIEDIDELSLILQRVINSMETYLKSFDKDGITAEGLSYWSYGFSFYVFFAELLKERTCGRISLLKNQDKVKNIARIPQILQFPSGHFVNFSDSGRNKWQGECGLFAKLEKEFHIKGYNYENSINIYNDSTYRWAMMARKVFWYDNSSKSTNTLMLGSFYFRESQWLVDRSCRDGIFTAFAARGGNNDEPHNHNDLGHFLLHHNDENIFIDLGSPEYVKEYFLNETRYNFLTASSFGHSVPVINGNGQSFGKEHASKVVKYENANSTTIFTLNLAEAYDCKELIGFHREFVWNSDMLELTIRDSFKFNKAHNDIKESFITDYKPELINRGRVKIKAKNSIAELIYSEELECIIEECIYKEHTGNDRLIYRTSILGSADENVTYDFRVKLTKNM
jgi:hypothetical protein